MKQVVIICHDFPPINSVAAIRPSYWLKNLSTYGIHPIVFARSWSEHVQSHDDKFRKEVNSRKHESTVDWDLFTVPVKETWRIKFINRFGFERFSGIRRILMMFDWIKYFFTISKDEFSDLFFEVDSYISNNKVDAIIVSGSPFHFFKYGWYFKRKFNTPWIPDYRDEWFNNHSKENKGRLSIIQQLELYFEKKWTSNAIAFTTVSEGLVQRISALIKKDGNVIRNGFDEKAIESLKIEAGSKFDIIYAGTIYDSEYIQVLENGIDSFYTSCNGAADIRFTFLGIDLNRTNGTSRIHRLKSKYPNWINIIPAMNYSDCMSLVSKSTATLSLIAGSINDGIVQTKIYDYLALNKLILNIESKPSGSKHEFSEHIIDCVNGVEFSNKIQELYEKWRNGASLSNNLTSEQIKEFSRAKQTERLANLLSTLIEDNE